MFCGTETRYSVDALIPSFLTIFNFFVDMDLPFISLFYIFEMIIGFVPSCTLFIIWSLTYIFVVLHILLFSLMVQKKLTKQHLQLFSISSKPYSQKLPHNTSVYTSRTRNQKYSIKIFALKSLESPKIQPNDPLILSILTTTH